MPTRTTTRTLISSGVTSEPQYLTGMDLLIGHGGSTCALVYPAGLDTDALAASLRQVLAHYPVFTGRYRRDTRGQVMIDGQDAGLSYVVTRHPDPMPNWGMGAPIGRAMGRYCDRIYPWSLVNRSAAPMSIQLHVFACGGCLMTVTAAHSLCDGNAFWAFMMDWVRCHGGHAVVPPVTDRNALIASASQYTGHPSADAWLLRECSLAAHARLYAGLAWQHVALLGNRRLCLPGATLSAWQRDAALSLPEAAPFSAHELAVAWVLRGLSAGMPPELPRSVGLVLDLRNRMGLGIARKYVGNALGRDLLELSAADLAHADLAQVAVRCRIPYDRIALSEQQAHLGLLEQYRLRHGIGRLVPEIAARSLSTGVLVNNCAHFPVYKIDFGSGPPSWQEREGSPYRRILLSPSPQRDGGLDLHITARRAELAGLPASVN